MPWPAFVISWLEAQKPNSLENWDDKMIRRLQDWYGVTEGPERITVSSNWEVCVEHLCRQKQHRTSLFRRESQILWGWSSSWCRRLPFLCKPLSYNVLIFYIYSYIYFIELSSMWAVLLLKTALIYVSLDFTGLDIFVLKHYLAWIFSWM